MRRQSRQPEDSTQPSRRCSAGRYRSLWLAVAVSFLAHGVAFYAWQRWDPVFSDPPPRPARQPLQVARIELPAAPAVDTAIQEAPPPVAAPQKKPRANAGQRNTPTEPPSPAIEDASHGTLELPRGPRKANLMPEFKLEAAPDPRELSESERVQARLDKLGKTKAQRGHTLGDPISPEVRGLGLRLSQWFTLSTEVQERLLAHGAFRPLPELGASTTGAPGHGLQLPMLCFGACSQTSHKSAEAGVVVEIQHDAEGRPHNWQVVASSGDEEFDAAALRAVTDAQGFASNEVFGQGQEPAWSRWLFSAQAYRWGRGELILDPSFRPSGQVLESQSNWRGKTTVDKSALLIAVRYHKDSASPHGASDDLGSQATTDRIESSVHLAPQ